MKPIDRNTILLIEVMSNCSTFTSIVTNITSLVAWLSELLTTKREVPGSIAGSAVVIFLCRGR
jgi:hypothetical protein